MIKNIKEMREDILRYLSASDVEKAIIHDLNLVVKNKKYKCHMHNDKNPSMSFYEPAKLFKCFACGGTYNIFDHYMDYYGLTFIDAMKRIVSDFSLPITFDLPKQNQILKEDLKKVKPIMHEKLSEGVVNAYIKSRGINISSPNIKDDGKGNVVFTYCDSQGAHVANKYRPAHKLNKGELKTWFQAGCNANTLFNMERIDIGQPLIICEGEFDCLSLIQSGFDNTVSIPTGCQSEAWITCNWEWLELFECITLWFDNDEAGLKGVTKVAKRLPNKIVKIVEQNIAKDINELLWKGKLLEIKECIKRAKIWDSDEFIFMNQIENFNINEVDAIETGIDKFDSSMIGFIEGTLSIITGHSGHGKSTLVNQLCIAESLHQGHTVYCFSGELLPHQFKYWVYQTLANSEDFEYKESQRRHRYYWSIKNNNINNITSWIGHRLILQNGDSNCIDNILVSMEKAAKKYEAKVFVLDNLMKLDIDSVSPLNELKIQKDLVTKLRAFATKYKAVVHLVAHPRKSSDSSNSGLRLLTENDIAGSKDIYNLADYVIGIYRTQKSDIEYYKKRLNTKPGDEKINDPKDACISLIKERHAGSNRIDVFLNFDKKRKRFYSEEKELEKHYYGAYNQVAFNEEDFWDVVERDNKSN